MDHDPGVTIRSLHGTIACPAQRRGFGRIARGLGVVVLLCLQSSGSLAGSSQDSAWQVVNRGEILEAMRLQSGYDPTATTNAARFQAEVLLHLARRAKARNPTGPPLFLQHTDWFEAFLTLTGRTEETAPTYALLGYRNAQDLAVDFRSDRVIRETKVGPTPELAVNVMVWWVRGPDTPDNYSYVDSLSTPQLKVTNKSVITYRLLDLGDVVVYDQVEGLTGRPISGALGLLFRVMGEGSVKWSRMTIAQDGLQVTRARAKKAFIGVTSTVTVYPDGRTEEDVPPDRPDLLALEERLKTPLEIDYVPFAWFPEGSRRDYPLMRAAFEKAYR